MSSVPASHSEQPRGRRARWTDSVVLRTIGRRLLLGLLTLFLVSVVVFAATQCCRETPPGRARPRRDAGIGWPPSGASST